MLVLTRYQGEEIVISDNIRVVVLETHRGYARIGIEAPKDVSILREELVEEGLSSCGSPR